MAGVSRIWKRKIYWATTIMGLLLLIPLLSGCGQESAEATVRKFLGGVQAHDFNTMRSCIDPEAISKAEDTRSGLSWQWEQLNRRYTLKPVDWRFEFEDIQLQSEYPESDAALVRIAGGGCKLYDLREDKWVQGGEIDFSAQDFVPIYLVKRGDKWFIEALDIYVVNALEKQARNVT